MSRLRLILVSVLAVFAVAGVASASASAVEFQICANAGAGHNMPPSLNVNWKYLLSVNGDGWEYPQQDQLKLKG